MKNIRALLSRNTEKILFIFAILLSLLSFLYCYQHDIITLYSDARGHLNIARRVFDNLTPGVAQLGGVWLPLLHLLMLPTIWINFMWSSGISGSLVSMPMFVLTAIFVYKTVLQITNSKLSGILAFLVVASNINLLYLQATPMTESLFIGTLTISVYLLTMWLKTGRLHYLMVSSLFIFLTSMNRYEGWVVALGMVFSLFVSKQLVTSNKKITNGKIILFGTVALFGILLWLLWQLAIFHNPIYFLNSEFSAKGQTLISIAQGQVPTYKNAVTSVMTIIYSLVHVDGVIVTGISMLGIIIASYQILVKRNVNYFMLPILWIPAAFTIYALYKGNIPMNVPEIYAAGAPKFFNVRYAIYSLPAIAIFLGLIPLKKLTAYSLIVAIVTNAYLLTPFYSHDLITTLQDAKGAELVEIKAVEEWFRASYDGGYILASAATNDPIIFGLKLDMKQYITEGSGKYWVESIENPSKYASWAIIANSERDMVKKYIAGNKFYSSFEPVATSGTFTVYRKNANY